MSTRSGSEAATISSARLTVGATPTTSMSASKPKAKVSASARGAWSSTTSTRIWPFSTGMAAPLQTAATLGAAGSEVKPASLERRSTV